MADCLIYNRQPICKNTSFFVINNKCADKGVIVLNTRNIYRVNMAAMSDDNLKSFLDFFIK